MEGRLRLARHEYFEGMVEKVTVVLHIRSSTADCCVEGRCLRGVLFLLNLLTHVSLPVLR